MDISIGTNVVECGPSWRMERRHLAAIAEAGGRFVDLHMGAHYQAGEGMPAIRPIRCFVEFHNERYWREIATWLSDLGLAPVCAHTSIMGCLDISSGNEAVRRYAVEELRAMAPFCAFLHVPVMVVHPGEATGREQGHGDSWGRVKRSLGELLPDLERAGVKAALENLLPGSISTDIGELVAAVEETGHPLVGVCLDTGHLNVVKGRPAAAVRAIGARLFALHVHDNNGQSDQHLPPFEGSADWTGFAAALREVGYRGTLNLEVLDHAQPGAIARPDFIRRALRNAEQLLLT